MSPRLYIVSRPQVAEGLATFLEHQGLAWKESGDATPAERLIEFAGRICYLSFGEDQYRKDNASYIANLIAQGHESVLEHACWTFVLSGVSRAFTHQLVRHRVGFSYSQLSQQYHDEADAEFVQPFGVQASPVALKAWQDAIVAAQTAYRAIQEELGGAKQNPREVARAIRSAARSVMPNATATIIAVTANARAIRHFLSLRGAIEGDYEMRMVSTLLYHLLAAEAPALVTDYELGEMEDGSPVVRPK